MQFNNLPENVQYKINKYVFSSTVLPMLCHKDWWWHTVNCRANKGRYKMENPVFLDAEKCLGSLNNYFCSSVGISKKRKYNNI